MTEKEHFVLQFKLYFGDFELVVLTHNFFKSNYYLNYLLKF